ncbi:hypothetical protein C8F01DRAFT_1236979 [Mycena amicta]|nr:hypothetical protein C8F01DRAFT_1236979 [Mycena amicta]
MPSVSSLPPETLLCVLAQCDIATVLAASSTCRLLHEIASTKQLWISLCRRLQFRGILSSTFTPELTGLSTEELIDLVARAVYGPTTWNRGDEEGGSAAPKVKNQLRFRVPIPRLHPHWHNEVKVLPSGRYVLFKNNLRLQCWDTTSGRLVWTHAPAVDRADVEEFAAEEGRGVGGGSDLEEGKMRVLVCLKAGRNCRVPGVFVEILEVDLRARSQHRLFLTRPTYEPYTNKFAYPSILGPIAAVIAGEQRIYILNWETRSDLFIDVSSDSDFDYSFMLMPGRSGPCVALVPGHIIVKVTQGVSETAADKILLVAHHTLSKLWCKFPEGYDALLDIDDYEPEGVSSRKLRPLCVVNATTDSESEASGNGSAPLRMNQGRTNRGRAKGKGKGKQRRARQHESGVAIDSLFVCANPLRENGYRIWVRAVSLKNQEHLLDYVAWDDIDDALERAHDAGTDGGELLAYDIILPDDTTKAGPLVKLWKPGGRFKRKLEVTNIPYSGHIVEQGFILMPSELRDYGEELDLDEAEDVTEKMDAGRCEGTVVYATGHEIVLKYYE